jgi:hypothetical protein
MLPPPRGRGWSAIGYHYVILNGRISAYRTHNYFDGHIETGRPLDDDADISSDEFGAHPAGWNNAVGICLIGLSGCFTEAQMRALQHLIVKLRCQFGEIKIMQHSDVEPKKPKCAGLTSLMIKTLNKT